MGGENDLPLVKRLCQGFSGSFVGFNLENELPRFRQAGFRVMRSDQATSEPAAEPRPGPTGMPWSLAQLMNSCTMRK